MDGRVRYGARAPESLVIDIAPSSVIPDMSVVTAATLKVRTPVGIVSMAVTRQYPASPTAPLSLRLTHIFLDTDPQANGVYVAVPYLTVPGAPYPIRCEPVSFSFVDEFYT